MTLGHFAIEVARTLRIQGGSPFVHVMLSSLQIQTMSTGKKRSVEALWQDFFSNTSQWWDHRPEKINPRFPDFKHKLTGEALWLADTRNPPWVQAELAAIPPCTLQSNVFTWAQRLRRYVKAGQYVRTMEAFQQMQQDRVCPDTRTFLSVLSACAGLGNLEEGKRIHTQIVEVGCDSNLYIGTCLIDMYAKCGSIEDAWRVFSNMQEPNVVSWNTMIGGSVKSGQGSRAIELFKKMQLEGVEPDAVTFVGVLNACTSLLALEEGKCVHKQIIGRGYESNVYVANCLLDMYAKCGIIENAWNVFSKMQDHNVVSWNTMIGGYVKSGQGLKALELFGRMQQEGVEPDPVTFVGMLNACASLEALEEGRRVHGHIIRRGCESDVCIANCLVDMYAKCGRIEDAWSVFNKMQGHDVVSWSAMIGGYVKSGHGVKAMELFQKMQQEGVEPNVVTFKGVLNACASVAALEEGRRVHEQIIQKGCQSDVSVATCLVDMYSKCGSIGDAWSVFDNMQEHDAVSWNAMIGGYAMHGDAKKAIGLLKQMNKEGVEIDAITFICLLSACNHGGLVNEGLRYFRSMSSCFNILPTMEHYTCIIDLLGRAGRLEEAEEMLKRVPMERNAPVWMSFLSACRIHGNIKMAKQAVQRCWELDPNNASGYLLLSNICVAAGHWDIGLAHGSR